MCGDDADRLAEVSGYAGVAYGLTGLLRALPIHTARGQCYLPNDVLHRHGLTAGHVLSRRYSKEMDAVLGELRQLAAARLAAARELSARVPDAALAAYLPVSLVDLYLGRLANGSANPFQDVIAISPFRRQARLWTMVLRKRY